MAQTPDSAATPYCDAATFLDFYDARLVGDLVRDDETEADAAGLPADPRLARILMAASGQVESACAAGGRYRPADLQGLAGAGRALLQQLVADLAIGLLRRRRGVLEGDAYAQYTEAQAALEDLRSGKRIFPTAEAEAAGLPASSYLREVDRRRQGLVSTLGRAFGRGMPGGFRP